MSVHIGVVLPQLIYVGVCFQFPSASRFHVSPVFDTEHAGSFAGRLVPSLLQTERADNQSSLSPNGYLSSKVAPSLDGSPLDGGAVQPIGTQPWDWLFDSSATSCQKPDWDNTQDSLTSRIYLPIQFALLVFLIVFLGRSQPIVESVEDGHDTLQTEGAEKNLPQRRYDIDFARIMCVFCVVVEHSGGTHWTRRNVLFVLQWVLPYLHLTSGISLMRSSRDTRSYVLRLFGLLVAGVSVNWLADIYTGRDWRGDFGNTIFQMFYVVMLIVMSVTAAPLKRTLKLRVADPDVTNSSLFWVPTILSGALTGVAFLFYAFPSLGGNLSWKSDVLWMRNLNPVLRSAPLATIQVVGLFFLCHLSCMYKANSVVPWLLAIHIFVPRVVIPWNKVGFFHCVELLIFAMVVESWNVMGRVRFVKVIRNYWPIMIGCLALAAVPDLYGRCDLLPANTWVERLRFYGIELLLAMCLCTGAFMVGDPYNLTEWLNWWAYGAYCFHVAIARLLPIPYGAVLTDGLFFVFIGQALHSTRKKTMIGKQAVLAG